MGGTDTFNSLGTLLADMIGSSIQFTDVLAFAAPIAAAVIVLGILFDAGPAWAFQQARRVLGIFN